MCKDSSKKGKRFYTMTDARNFVKDMKIVKFNGSEEFVAKMVDKNYSDCKS